MTRMSTLHCYDEAPLLHAWTCWLNLMREYNLSSLSLLGSICREREVVQLVYFGAKILHHIIELLVFLSVEDCIFEQQQHHV